MEARWDCKTRGYAPAGTGTGKPGVHLCGPLRKPVPAQWVRVFGGYGSGYIQKYPGVTRALHYAYGFDEGLVWVSHEKLTKYINLDWRYDFE
jgi:hypothetical protein